MIYLYIFLVELDDISLSSLFSLLSTVQVTIELVFLDIIAFPFSWYLGLLKNIITFPFSWGHPKLSISVPSGTTENCIVLGVFINGFG